VYLTLDTPGLDSSVTRPSVVSITGNVVNLLQTTVDADVRYIEEFEGYELKKLKRWNIIKNDKDFGSLKDDILLVNYKLDNRNPDIYIAKDGEVRPPVISDVEAGLKIVPNYSSTAVELNVTYFTKSRTNKNKLVNRLSTLAHKNRLESLGEITYYYYPNNKIFELMNEINILRDKGDNLFKYVSEHSDVKMTEIKSLSNGNSELVFKENQTGVVVRLISDAVNPSVSHDRETGYWEIQVDFKFSFDSPNKLNVYYNDMINKQFLPEKFRLVTNTHRDNGEVVFKSGDMGWLDYTNVSNTSKKLLKGRRYVVVPNFDNHKPSNTPLPGLKLVSVLTTVDGNSLFNIDSIPEVKLKPVWREFLRKEYRYIGRARSSILHFHVEDIHGNLVEDNVKMDKDGNLTTVKVLDPEKAYRVFLNIMADTTTLNDDVLGRLTTGMLLDSFELTENKALTDKERYIAIKHNSVDIIKTKRSTKPLGVNVTLVAHLLEEG